MLKDQLILAEGKKLIAFTRVKKTTAGTLTEAVLISEFQLICEELRVELDLGEKR